MDLLVFGLGWLGIALVSIAAKVCFCNYNMFCLRETQEEG